MLYIHSPLQYGAGTQIELSVERSAIFELKAPAEYQVPTMCRMTSSLS